MNPIFTRRGQDGRRRFNPEHLAWIIPAFLALAAALFFAIGNLFVWLWRVTLVDLFAFKPVSFWQAWGLILLSQILFKAHIQRTTRTGRWRHRCTPSGGDAPQADPGRPVAPS